VAKKSLRYKALGVESLGLTVHTIVQHHHATLLVLQTEYT